MSKPKIHKTVYFVRHGESEHNILPVFQSPDSPLSEKGKKQAELIAKRVSKLSFDVLVSSTFLRAKETAEAISHLTSKTPELSELFVERIKPASINGKSYEDENASKVWRRWEES